jgi:hypothetical protein
MYVEFATDPEVQMLAFEDQRHFVMALCMKGAGVLDKIYPDAARRERIIAAYLGLDPVSAAEAKRRLRESGLVDDAWHPVNWEKRQYRSDHDGAERKRRQRERERAAGGEGVTTVSRDSHGLDQNRTDPETDPEQIAPPVAAQEDRWGEWNRWCALYPKGTYRHSRFAIAERLWNGHRNEGVTAERLEQAARAYTAQQTAMGKIGTQYINAPDTFLTGDNWDDEFPLPATPQQQRKDAEAEKERAAEARVLAYAERIGCPLPRRHLEPLGAFETRIRQWELDSEYEKRRGDAQRSGAKPRSLKDTLAASLAKPLPANPARGRA